MSKFRNVLSKMAYGIYGMLYCGILLVVLFRNVSFEYSMPVMLLLITIIFSTLALILKIYSNHSDLFVKNRFKILIIFCIFSFTMQLLISSQMIPVALYDHDKVLNGAITYTLEGKSTNFGVYEEYLHHYPHQMGLFLIQHIIFKVALAFGYTNFFFVACIVGRILFQLMIVSSFLYIDENISSHRSLFFLLIIGSFMPFYFQSSISYTDTYSVWAASCILLFFSRAINAEKMSKRLFNAVVCGIVVSVALQIKSTSGIVLIALMIQLFVKGVKKKDLILIAVLVVSMIGANAGIKQWKYNTVMVEENLRSSMPVTHWIMMGLQGDGSYSTYDEWNITCAVPQEQRVEKNIQVIKERLKEMGPIGYIKLLYRKTCRTFGSGDAESYYTFLYEPQAEPVNIVYEFTLSNGKYFTFFKYSAQSVYLCAIILGITGAFIVIKNKKAVFNFAAHISLIGFWIFMMLWESNHRQLINQWSLLFIVAAIGLYHINESIKSR